MRVKKQEGYSFIIAIIAVNVFAILILMGRSMWETELARDLEEELIFRARQYVKAIELFKQKHVNVYPKTLEVLYEEKFLRKQFKDPMTDEGNWDIVMQQATGGKQTLLIVPENLLPEYESKAFIVGVCSTCEDEGFREYRKKKKYNEWAIYLGEDLTKDMPDITYVAKDTENKKGDSSFDPDNKPSIPDDSEQKKK